MNKLLITLCLAALFMLSGCYNSGEPREKVLKIYNWADYIGDGVLEDFQAYYKAVSYTHLRRCSLLSGRDTSPKRAMWVM